MTQIRAVIFDWGGVLIDDPRPGLMDYCARALGVGLDDYIAANDAFAGEFQAGLIGEDEFWRRVCGRLGCEQPKRASLWGDAFEAAYREKKAVFELAGRLRAAGYRTGFLSNTEKAAMAFFHTRGYDMFDALVFSCAEGCDKPDTRIYEIAVEKLGAEPAEAVFIDDRTDYIEGARAAGLATILFESVEQMMRELTAMGIEAD